MEKNINLFKYENGSKIIVEQDLNAKYVAFIIRVAVGAGDEKSEEYGVAHFLEHLFFKSTKNMSTFDISLNLEKLGAKINASTSHTKTCYKLQCLPENLDKCLEIYSDMLFNGLFLKEEIDKERSVILEEFKMYQDDPMSVAYKNCFTKLMEGNKFDHDILGDMNVIKNISIESILNFKKRTYTPDKFIFSIYGNVNSEQIKKILEKYFHKILNKKYNKIKKILPIKINPQTNLIVENQNKEQTQICILINSVKAKDMSKYSVFLLQEILGGGMSSRLFEILREKLGYVYSTYADFFCSLEFGLFGIYAGVSNKNVKNCIKEIKNIINNLINNGISEDDLLKAKINVKSNMVYSLDKKIHIALLNAEKYYNFNEIITLKDEFKLIDNESIESVNKAIKNLFLKNKYVVSIVGKNIKENEIKAIL